MLANDQADATAELRATDHNGCYGIEHVELTKVAVGGVEPRANQDASNSRAGPADRKRNRLDAPRIDAGLSGRGAVAADCVEAQGLAG
jgi:hypothetical protein